MKFLRPFSLTRPGRLSKGTSKGQTLVEYTLILAILSILIVAVMFQLSGNVRGVYSAINSQVARGKTGS